MQHLHLSIYTAGFILKLVKYLALAYNSSVPPGNQTCFSFSRPALLTHYITLLLFSRTWSHEISFSILDEGNHQLQCVNLLQKTSSSPKSPWDWNVMTL
uniref:Uncharacterized protein n=1 Tax=Anguilla anguilla TaxID=7936 RepID=A0A0E9WIN8_ANGAN